jgi:hypothetical protein
MRVMYNREDDSEFALPAAPPQNRACSAFQ